LKTNSSFISFFFDRFLAENKPNENCDVGLPNYEYIDSSIFHIDPLASVEELEQLILVYVILLFKFEEKQSLISFLSFNIFIKK